MKDRGRSGKMELEVILRPCELCVHAIRGDQPGDGRLRCLKTGYSHLEWRCRLTDECEHWEKKRQV
jgi:hypothetical protein